MEMAIEINRMVKRINNKEILSNINLKINKGERFGIFGPSGSGKTMILRCVAGLEKIDGGEIYLRKRKVSSSNYFIQPEERNIAMIFQELALWPHMTSEEHIKFVRPSADTEYIYNILEMVGLEGKKKSKPHQLSGGEKQRLAIARAVAQESDILLLDEPFSSLDVGLKKEIMNLVNKIQKKHGITTVYVGHDIFDTVELCDRIALIKNGKIVKTGHPKKLLGDMLRKIK